MEEGIKFFVGLDVHKETISVGVAEAGREPGRLRGTMAHDVARLLKLLAQYGEPNRVHVVYEAGPTGFGLQRALAKRGYGSEVIAPPLIPKRAGDRVKTDRRDCIRLAELSSVITISICRTSETCITAARYGRYRLKATPPVARDPLAIDAWDPGPIYRMSAANTGNTILRRIDAQE